LLNPVIPINKKIWTDSFMFLSGGFSLVAFGLSHWIVDLSHWAENRRGRLLLTPALIYGSNAVLGFSLANILSPLLGVLQFKGENGAPTALPGLGFQWFSHFLNPWNASLAYAVAFVLLIMAILWPLYRRGIFVRL
jgi:predicted acyltransferase